jgi:hypothetical protein
MKIEWTARDKSGNRASGPTVYDAIARFLDTYKSRSFRVTEYRDGIHKQVIRLGGPPLRDDDNYGSYHFASRAVARAFLVHGITPPPEPPAGPPALTPQTL